METELQNEYQTIRIEDDSSAIYLDGQYFIPSTEETEYFIQNTGDILFNCPNENSVLINNDLIDANNEEPEDNSQVVYFTNDADFLTRTGIVFMENVEHSMNKNETEKEFLELGSFLDIRNEENEMNGFQYIVQLPNYNAPQDIQDYYKSDITVDPSLPSDFSTKDENLLGCDSVTLESYLEKFNSSINVAAFEQEQEVLQNETTKNDHNALSNLLNKKLTLGKTVNGQRLVGKVIHVGKKMTEKDESEIQMQLQSEEVEKDYIFDGNIDSSVLYYDALENHVPNSVIIEDDEDANILLENINESLIKDATDQSSGTIERQQSVCKIADKDMMDYVSDTMSNLVNMESVLKKLKRKNLLIKVIERVVEEDQAKVNNFQIGGHIEMLGGWQRHEYEENWVFKSDFEKDGGDCGEWNKLWSRKFPETIKLTISIVKVNGLIQSTKVDLNYNLQKCNVCFKEFKSTHKLKTHMKLSHDMDCRYRCQICDESFEKKEEYDQHRIYHVDNKELFPCSVCDKHFLTVQKLAKHMYSHSVDNLKLSCTVCGEVFDKISNWREHMLRHEGNKSSRLFKSKNRGGLEGNCQTKDYKNCYSCKVCSRTFSRYTNLQRHSEIHGTKNSMPVYSCSMCGCTYNYMSSLTRHVVQNHISAS